MKVESREKSGYETQREREREREIERKEKSGNNATTFMGAVSQSKMWKYFLHGCRLIWLRVVARFWPFCFLSIQPGNKRWRGGIPPAHPSESTNKTASNPKQNEKIDTHTHTEKEKEKERERERNDNNKGKSKLGNKLPLIRFFSLSFFGK